MDTSSLTTAQVWLLAVGIIWELIWKGFGLWRSARASQPVWFVAILVVNSLGLLPIIYLLLTQQKHKTQRA